VDQGQRADRHDSSAEDATVRTRLAAGSSRTEASPGLGRRAPLGADQGLLFRLHDDDRMVASAETARDGRKGRTPQPQLGNLTNDAACAARFLV